MQTFLPYTNYADAVAVLDSKRLGKQRVETLQIMNALADPEYGWQNHSVTRMWREFPVSLMAYQVATCNEWVSRVTVKGKNFTDTCLMKTYKIFATMNFSNVSAHAPWWLDGEDGEKLARSHRSNLLRKKPEHYAPLFEDDLPDDLEYVWPVPLTD